MTISTSSQQTRPFNYNLEFLRGIAALLVVYHHAIEHKSFLDPAYAPHGIWSFNPPGHISVLVFFVLSGYVIGLTNPAPLRGAKIVDYIKKRFWRIYPIFIVTTIFTWVIAWPNYSISDLFDNFLFNKIMGENPVVWSLSFEVYFYLTFILISAFKLSEKLLALAAFITSLILVLFFSNSSVNSFIMYTSFLCYWLLGVVIANVYRKADFVNVNHPLLFSSVLSLISLEYFNVILTVFNRVVAFARPAFMLSNSDWNTNIGLFRDFASLPFCITIILLFVGAKNKVVIYSYYLLQIINAFTFLYIFQHRHEQSIISFTIPSLLFAFSVLWILLQRNKFFIRTSQKVMRRGAILGGLSYGIYIIHFPLLYLFGQVHTFSGSIVTYIIRFIVFVAVTMLAAYVLEKIWQPFVRQLFLTTRAR